MRAELPGEGAQKIWLNQPSETKTMTLRLIQQRSRELRAKTRRKMLGTLAGPFAVGVICVFGLKEFAALRQVLQPLFVLALAWSLAGLYFLNRGMRSAAMPGDAGLSAGLEFCKREMERQRDLVRRGLLWLFAPNLLGLATVVAALAIAGTKGRGIIPNGLPFLSLVVVWVVAYFIVRARELRNLQYEIGELDAIQRENQG
jgi:hypothetical protein